MSGFLKTDDAAFRKYARAVINDGSFTVSEKAVTIAIVNIWFHHKSFIHPGREKLAKKAGVTIKTVSRCLKMLRDCGGIQALSHVAGGYGTATRYDVDILAILSASQRHKCPGNVPVVAGQMSHGTTYRDKGHGQGASLRIVRGGKI